MKNLIPKPVEAYASQLLTQALGLSGDEQEMEEAHVYFGGDERQEATLEP